MDTGAIADSLANADASKQMEFLEFPHDSTTYLWERG